VYGIVHLNMQDQTGAIYSRMIIDNSSLPIFISASFILAMSPGPDNLFVITQSALYSWRAGLLIVFGLCLGLIVHSTLVALGLASIIASSPKLFSIMKLLGACYLAYLAWQAYHAGVLRDKTASQLNKLGLVRRGFVMNVSNPKVAIFFLAFLPQFIDIHQGEIASQILFLGFIFILVTFTVFGSMAYLSSSLANRLIHSRRAQLLMNKLTAAVLLSLAIYMSLQTN